MPYGSASPGRGAQESFEFGAKAEQGLFQVFELIRKTFMPAEGVFIGDAVEGRHLKAHLAVMHFDGLFEIVDVNKLDVKLVVEMFYFLELFFGEGLAGGLAEFVFVL